MASAGHATEQRPHATHFSSPFSSRISTCLPRYFGNTGTYVGLRYGRGGWREELRNRNDLEVLDSDVGAAEATVILRGRLELRLRGSYSREDRVERRDLRQYSLSTGLGVRF